MSDVVLVCLQVSDDLTGIYQGDYNTSTIHETACCNVNDDITDVSTGYKQ